MLTVVLADKGSPGVSTTAWAIAAAWPVPAVLVEADPAGGDLAVRAHRGHDRPLATVATTATLAAESTRTDDRAALLRRVARPWPGLAGVVPGFATAVQGAAITGLWDDLALTLQSADADVVVDVGRFGPGSPAEPIVDRADTVVVVLRPDLVSLLQAREQITHLLNTGLAGRVVPVVIAPGRVAEAHCRDVADVLAERDLVTEPPVAIGWDPRALERLTAGDDPTGRLARTLLLRTATQAAHHITGTTITAAESVSVS